MVSLNTFRPLENKVISAVSQGADRVSANGTKYAKNLANDTFELHSKAVKEGVTSPIAKTTAAETKTAVKNDNVLYDDIDLTKEDAKIVFNGNTITLKGPQRKKFRKMEVGQTAFVGGGSSADKELFNIPGLEVNQFEVTKNADNSFSVVNRFATASKTNTADLLKSLDKIKYSRPEFYELVKNGLESKQLPAENLEAITKFIDNPITEPKFVRSITDYKNDGFKYINKYMRGDKLNVHSNYDYQILRQIGKATENDISSAYATKMKRDVRNLTDLTNANTFNNPLTLYRGDTYAILDNVVIKNGKYQGKKLSEILEGAQNKSIEEKTQLVNEILADNKNLEYTQPSFLSTSLMSGGQKDWKPVQTNITTKGPINGICIDANIDSVHKKELEFLVGKNSNVAINSIKPDKSGQWILDVTLTQG